MREKKQKSWQKVVNKYIETSKACEQYQIDLVTLSDYLSWGKKILLNDVDHFSKLATSVLIKIRL